MVVRRDLSGSGVDEDDVLVARARAWTTPADADGGTGTGSERARRVILRGAVRVGRRIRGAAER